MIFGRKIVDRKKKVYIVKPKHSSHLEFKINTAYYDNLKNLIYQ